ncbi:hypothetical protein ANCCEY_13962 [Ancylostoma ceylanicum]|uniref:Uncharacterized protein n=1 Tax=Ancylostoma ceylanicum TaxID=53326 RepID=A0A0D6LAZ1_9BILA|nr:hypothetical protein ANCCEY_13962 [Ancylostoma ceylanicum]
MAGGPRIAMERATLPQLRKSVTKKATGTGDDVRMKFECFKCQCRQPGIPFKVDEKSIVQWTQSRDVLVDYYTTNLTRIEGPNTVVQVDETHIVRKNNVGRIVSRDWLVGGIQDGTKTKFSWRSRMITALQISMPSSRGM